MALQEFGSSVIHLSKGHIHLIFNDLGDVVGIISPKKNLTIKLSHTIMSYFCKDYSMVDELRLSDKEKRMIIKFKMRQLLTNEWKHVTISL